MGDEAEMRATRMTATRLGPDGAPVGEPVEIRGDVLSDTGVEVTVTPPDDDEFMAVRATDLVGRVFEHDTLGRATVRRDGGFVVVDYPDAGPFHRTHIRSDAWVRIRRAPRG